MGGEHIDTHGYVITKSQPLYMMFEHYKHKTLKCIYLITLNGKKYVGQTNNTRRRFCRHRKPDSECRYFSNAIQTHGWENATIEILLVDLTLKEANRLETHYIDTVETLMPDGYNLTRGGDNREWCDEAREAQREMVNKLYEDAEYKGKQKEGVDRVNQDPGFNEKRKVGITNFWGNEENMNNESERRKLLWETEDYRAKMKISLNTEEVKDKKSKSRKQLWEDPTYRDNTTSAIKLSMEKFRKFTDAEFLEANTRLGGKIPLLAEDLNVTITTVKEHRKRLGLSRPYVKKNH